MMHGPAEQPVGRRMLDAFPGPPSPVHPCTLPTLALLLIRRAWCLYCRRRPARVPQHFAAADGHWGVQHGHSMEILVEKFDIRCSMLHDVGTDSSGKFSVFMNGKMSDGNLDLHRWADGWCAC